MEFNQMSQRIKYPRPPKHLSAEAKSWWKTVVNDYELAEHHLKILQTACESWDRMVQARNALAEHGLTYRDGHDCPRARPEVRIEADSRVLFLRAVRELGLDETESPEAPRPPRIAGKY